MAEPLVGIDAPISTLWNVDTCPADILPWLAWTFSVELWAPAWPEGTKRAVLRSSIAVHRSKGTKQSILDALAGIGFEAAIAEWFETGADPHTFALTAFAKGPIDGPEGSLDAARNQALQVIEHTKPVRAHLSAFRLGYMQRQRLTVAQSAVVAVRLSGRAEPRPAHQVAQTRQTVSHTAQVALRLSGTAHPKRFVN